MLIRVNIRRLFTLQPSYSIFHSLKTNRFEYWGQYLKIFWLLSSLYSWMHKKKDLIAVSSRLSGSRPGLSVNLFPAINWIRTQPLHRRFSVAARLVRIDHGPESGPCSPCVPFITKHPLLFFFPLKNLHLQPLLSHISMHQLECHCAGLLVLPRQLTANPVRTWKTPMPRKNAPVDQRVMESRGERERECAKETMDYA